MTTTCRKGIWCSPDCGRW